MKYYFKFTLLLTVKLCDAAPGLERCWVDWFKGTEIDNTQYHKDGHCDPLGSKIGCNGKGFIVPNDQCTRQKDLGSVPCCIEATCGPRNKGYCTNKSLGCHNGAFWSPFMGQLLTNDWDSCPNKGDVECCLPYDISKVVGSEDNLQETAVAQGNLINENGWDNLLTAESTPILGGGSLSDLNTASANTPVLPTVNSYYQSSENNLPVSGGLSIDDQLLGSSSQDSATGFTEDCLFLGTCLST